MYTVDDIMACRPCHDRKTVECWMDGRPTVSALEIANCDDVFMYDRIWILIRLLWTTSVVSNVVEELGFTTSGWWNEEDVTICLCQARMDEASEEGSNNTEPYQKHQLNLFIKEIKNVLL